MCNRGRSDGDRETLSSDGDFDKESCDEKPDTAVYLENSDGKRGEYKFNGDMTCREMQNAFNLERATSGARSQYSYIYNCDKGQRASFNCQSFDQDGQDPMTLRQLCGRDEHFQLSGVRETKPTKP